MVAPAVKRFEAVFFDCFGVLYIQSYRRKEMIRNKPLVEYAQSLRSAGYKVGLLSNMSLSTLSKYFTESEQADLFDAVILSGEVGLPKPHPDIFEYGLDRLNVTAERAIMIDDDSSNVLSAKALGMEAICYEDSKQLYADLKNLSVRV